MFATIHPIELTKEELTYLDEAARENWKQVRPAIFGSIFEGTGNQKERHAYGMHFTSEADIMKIVKPTISNYWESKIENANTIAELETLQLELQNYQVLDPACGSGNFLYIAYQELKEIEQILLNKIASRRKSKTLKGQGQLSLVTPLQFHGIDINPFAVELAKVTLTIAKKVAIDRLELTEKDLPLNTLDKNIVCKDALFTDWVKADAIIGNPPFLDGKHMRLNLGDDYVEKVFDRFPKVKDVDFCSYWFRLAHDNSVNKDKASRIGLVGTNSISQGKTRKATLDYVTQKGHIHNAISTQPWSGEANVHVSIVNWCYQQPKQYTLDDKPVNTINSSIQPHVDVSKAKTLQVNKNKCFQGVIPNGKGFVITEEEAKEWIAKDSKNKEVLKLFSMGSNLAKNINGKPDRWIIDFDDMELEDASDYKLPFEKVKSTIPTERKNNRNNKLKKYWWQYEGKRIAMRKALKSLDFYFTVPRVSKWAVFIPAQNNWLCGDLNVVVASNDFYVLGILTSKVHRVWITKGNKSTLKSDIRYNKTTYFETFSFPQYDCKGASNCKGEQPFAPTGIVQKIRDKTIELHQYRTQQMEKKQWGITQLYNQYFYESASKLYKLHQQLDKLVMQAYNFKEGDDILSKLLELNLSLADKEKRGETVVGINALNNN